MWNIKIHLVLLSLVLLPTSFLELFSCHPMAAVVGVFPKRGTKNQMYVLLSQSVNLAGNKQALHSEGYIFWAKYNPNIFIFIFFHLWNNAIEMRITITWWYLPKVLRQYIPCMAEKVTGIPNLSFPISFLIKLMCVLPAGATYNNNGQVTWYRVHESDWYWEEVPAVASLCT